MAGGGSCVVLSQTREHTASGKGQGRLSRETILEGHTSKSQSLPQYLTLGRLHKHFLNEGRIWAGSGEASFSFSLSQPSSSTEALMGTLRTKPGREGAMREWEEQHRKAHWELDVHLLFYFYFLGIGLLPNQGKIFIFI